MIATTARCILLDVEGTTSSISFVYDQMFPFVRDHVAWFVEQNWESDDLQSCLPILAADLDASIEDWLSGDSATDQQQVVSGVLQLMDGDVKATGLKQLQGMIWKDGFESGQLVAHVFDDVPVALTGWKSSGVDIRIYSSGSVQAQKLFFWAYDCGNLLANFSGHYDTTTGPKKDSASYRAIARDWGVAPEEIVFVSDVVDELIAAREAGLAVALSIRPGNPPIKQQHEFESISSFDQIRMGQVHEG